MDNHLRRFLLTSLAGLFLAGQVLAHGTHATFLSPDSGAVVTKDTKVHIKRVSYRFPYVHITVRNVSTGTEKWSGLVPLSDDGYVQTIDVESWEAGSYVIEAQFLGDIVEQVQQRFVTVGTAEKTGTGFGASSPGSRQADE